MITNTSNSNHPAEQISGLLSLIGQPVRIKILLIISVQEACVCHMESRLELRQASISQHLMVLRKAGLVETHRNGRNIYYRLAHPEVVDVLRQTAQLIGSDPDILEALALRPVPGCPCPQCNPDLDPDLTCQSIHTGDKSSFHPV